MTYNIPLSDRSEQKVCSTHHLQHHPYGNCGVAVRLEPPHVILGIGHEVIGRSLWRQKEQGDVAVGRRSTMTGKERDIGGCIEGN